MEFIVILKIDSSRMECFKLRNIGYFQEPRRHAACRGVGGAASAAAAATAVGKGFRGVGEKKERDCQGQDFHGTGVDDEAVVEREVPVLVWNKDVNPNRRC